MMKYKKLSIILLTISSSVMAQRYIDADPFYLLRYEKAYFKGQNNNSFILFNL